MLNRNPGIIANNIAPAQRFTLCNQSFFGQRLFICDLSNGTAQAGGDLSRMCHYPFRPLGAQIQPTVAPTREP